MNEFALSELPLHGFCRVIRVEPCPSKLRLEGVGFTEGAEVVSLFCAPSGDPTAYSVRGSVVALRRSDAVNVIVRGRGEWV